MHKIAVIVEHVTLHKKMPVQEIQSHQNLVNDFDAALFLETRSTLKRTVFDKGRH